MLLLLLGTTRLINLNKEKTITEQTGGRFAFLGLKKDVTKIVASFYFYDSALLVSFYFFPALLFVTLINYILHKDHEKKNHIFCLSNTFKYPLLTLHANLCFPYHRSIFVLCCIVCFCMFIVYFTIINLCLYVDTYWFSTQGFFFVLLGIPTTQVRVLLVTQISLSKWNLSWSQRERFCLGKAQSRN